MTSNSQDTPNRFVAIGHVDAGKSALCGHLLYKCGFVDERAMEKIRTKAKADGMEKWIWSRILDIYEEEQLRGKTHEFDTVEWTYEGKSYELIDTPGHQRFVRSMIEGISENVNIAIVLVSMVDNEFEASFGKGMMKEHLTLTKAIGIDHLIVLPNKMDLINWDERLCKTKIKTVTKFLVKELNWNRDHLYVVPISAFNGTGLLNTAGMPKWYKGKSFIDTIDSITIDDVNIATPATSTTTNAETTTTRQCDRFAVNLNILNTGNSVITGGYQCIIHISGNEYECEIQKIKGKPFLISGDVNQCVIKLLYAIPLDTDVKLIIRKEESTVGYGKIIKLL
jgi:translation elongation factor EF-1alpha